MSNDELTKSIDSLIDELFSEEIEKAVALGVGESKETADEGKKPEKGKNDESRGAGRPKDIADVPENDEDGSRAKGYEAIQMKQGEKESPEVSQVKLPANVKKSFELSEEEYSEYQSLKKSKEEHAMEELRKSFISEQKDLIKSAVVEATEGIRKENEELKKSLDEQSELVKSMAKRPQTSKSITSVQALEKSQAAAPKQEYFSKSEMLDVAEELFKSGKLRDQHVIELENNGFIYDVEARKVLESELKRR